MGGNCCTTTTEDFNTSAARLHCFGSGNQKISQMKHQIRATEKVILLHRRSLEERESLEAFFTPLPSRLSGHFFRGRWCVASSLTEEPKDTIMPRWTDFFGYNLFIFTIYDLPNLQPARCRAYEFGELLCLTLSTHNIYHYYLHSHACLWTVRGVNRPLVDTLLPLYFFCFSVLRVGGRG